MKLKILLSGQRVGRAWTRGATEGLGRAVREGCGLDVHIVVGGTHPDAADQPCRPGAPRVPTGSFLGISPAPPPRPPAGSRGLLGQPRRRGGRL